MGQSQHVNDPSLHKSDAPTAHDEGVEVRLGTERKVMLIMGVVGGAVWGYWDVITGHRSVQWVDAASSVFIILMFLLARWLVKNSFIRADETGLYCKSGFIKQSAGWEHVDSYCIESRCDVKGRKHTFIVLKDAKGHDLLLAQRDWGPKQDTEKLISYIEKKLSLKNSTSA